MPSQAETGLQVRTAPAFVHSEVAEMRGSVVHWDGKHGIVRTDEGIEVGFFAVHLAANGYTGRVKVGDRLYFSCEVISTRAYCLDRIRAVALA
jgi:hypothetical protein